MVRVYINGIEIERAVHVITEEQYDDFKAIQDVHELNSQVLDNDELLGTPWYEGYDCGCAMCIDDDSISIEVGNVPDVELALDMLDIDNTEYDMTDVLSDSAREEGDYVLIAQSLSKGGYYVDIDISTDAFDAKKLRFVTRQYIGEFMYSDMLLDYIEYDGVMLDLECDSTRGKSFEVTMFELDEVLEIG